MDTILKATLVSKLVLFVMVILSKQELAKPAKLLKTTSFKMESAYQLKDTVKANLELFSKMDNA